MEREDPSDPAGEAEWMLAYVAREWQGCKPCSRFARSLPLVLRDYIDRVRKDETTREKGEDE